MLFFGPITIRLKLVHFVHESPSTFCIQIHFSVFIPSMPFVGFFHVHALYDHLHYPYIYVFLSIYYRLFYTPTCTIFQHTSGNAEQFAKIPSTGFLAWVVCQLSQNTKFQKVSPFAFQDYNDEIRQEQLRELSYLNGSEDSSRGRGIRGRGIRVPPAAPSRCGNLSCYVSSFAKCKQ